MGAPVADIIPGLIQTGIGIGQAPIELGAEIYNQTRNFDAGEAVKKAGRGHAEEYGSTVIPTLRGASDTVRGAAGKGNQLYAQSNDMIRQGESRALDQYKGIVSGAKANAQDLLQRISGFEGMAVEVQKQVEQAVQTALDNNDYYMDEMRGRADQAISEFSTKSADVAGGQIIGMRKNTSTQIQQFVNEAKRNGVSQMDIDAEVRRMKEETDSQVSNVWTTTTNNINTTRANMRVQNNAMLSGMMEQFGQQRLQGANINLAAGQVAVGAKQAGTAMAGQTYNYLTGTMMGVAKEQSDIIGSSAAMQAQTNQAAATYRLNSAVNIAQQEQTVATAQAQQLDYTYNAIVEGISVQVGRAFTPPNLANLTAPGLGMVQNGISSWRAARSQADAPSSGGGIVSGLFGLGGSAIGAGGEIKAAQIAAA